MIETTMDPTTWLRKQLDEGTDDLVRALLKQFAESLMSAEVDGICGAPYRSRSDARINRRNGTRKRRWDTRAGTIELEIPKLRSGSYLPEWLLEPRRRSEKALYAVVAECFINGVSTRKVERVWCKNSADRETSHPASIVFLHPTTFAADALRRHHLLRPKGAGAG